jgi:hypothetical protein
MYPYCAMFQAGDVAPSCSFLLQLLTAPGEPGLLVGLCRPEAESPVRWGRTGREPPYAEEVLLVTDIPRCRRPRGLGTDNASAGAGLGSDDGGEATRVEGVGGTAEGAEALQDLGGVLLLVEVDGEEGVVLLEVQGRGLAGAEEYGDVLHLDEGHGGLLELDAGGREGEIDESDLRTC